MAMIIYSNAQKNPCTTNPACRQFDFWVGEWDGYERNGKKPGIVRLNSFLTVALFLKTGKVRMPAKEFFIQGKASIFTMQ